MSSSTRIYSNICELNKTDSKKFKEINKKLKVLLHHVTEDKHRLHLYNTNYLPSDFILDGEQVTDQFIINCKKDKICDDSKYKIDDKMTKTDENTIDSLYKFIMKKKSETQHFNKHDSEEKKLYDKQVKLKIHQYFDHEYFEEKLFPLLEYYLEHLNLSSDKNKYIEKKYNKQKGGNFPSWDFPEYEDEDETDSSSESNETEPGTDNDDSDSDSEKERLNLIKKEEQDESITIDYNEIIKNHKHFENRKWFDEKLDINKIINTNDSNYFDATFFEKITINNPESEVIIIGDIHSSIHSLIQILYYLRINGKLGNNFELSDNIYLIFLGDIIDYGMLGIECLYIVMKMKLHNLNNCFIINGNHEDPSYMESGFSDFFDEMSNQYEFKEIIDVLKVFLNLLPSAIFLNLCGVRYQLCHGGFDSKYNENKKLKEFLVSDSRFFMEGYNSLSEVNQYKWGDFYLDDVEEGDDSRKKLSLKLTKEYLNNNDIRSILSGHQDNVFVAFQAEDEDKFKEFNIHGTDKSGNNTNKIFKWLPLTTKIIIELINEIESNKDINKDNYKEKIKQLIHVKHFSKIISDTFINGLLFDNYLANLITELYRKLLYDLYMPNYLDNPVLDNSENNTHKQGINTKNFTAFITSTAVTSKIKTTLKFVNSEYDKFVLYNSFAILKIDDQ